MHLEFDKKKPKGELPSVDKLDRQQYFYDVQHNLKSETKKLEFWWKTFFNTKKKMYLHLFR